MGVIFLTGSALCAVGTRRSRATKPIFLEMIEIVSIVLCAKLQKLTCKGVEIITVLNI